MNNRNSPQLHLFYGESKSLTFSSLINKYYSPSRKGRLMKYLHYIILIIIFIILVIILITLYQYLQVLFSIHNSIAQHLQLSSQVQLLSKSIASENKKKITSSLKSFDLNNRIKKLERISKVIKARIMGIKAKLSPNHDIFISMLRQSYLLSSIEQVELLYSWMPILRTDTYDVITMILLYRGSRDGDSLKDFHQKCDMKGGTLSIIKTKATEESPSYILGGFTDVDFSSKNMMVILKQGYTFIYSLDYKERYRTLSGIKGIISGSLSYLNYGTVLVVKENWKTSGTMHLISPYREDDHNHNPFPFHKRYYTIEDIEVFQVDITSTI